jgi:16S rRNA (adenine1518-N6/adenine1519-N6)-dimethyltransferase
LINQEKLRNVITRHGITPRKSLGQHFLLDPNLLDRIVRTAAPLEGAHVIEIGSGPGGLTRALLASDAASVTAIEIDPRAVAAITELQALQPDRLRIVEMDALQADLAALVAGPRVIVANLPYNIGTALLVGWLRQAGLFRSMTLMFQQEVAERIVAAPGSAAYGRLAVLAGLTTQADIVMHVPAAAFTPPPKVASAVVRLTPLVIQPSPVLLQTVAKVTEAAFGQRRKMLRGALKPLGGEALLIAAGIAPERRAETLTPAEFVRIAERLPKSGHSIY